jgi:hypothetical protein
MTSQTFQPENVQRVDRAVLKHAMVCGQMNTFHIFGEIFYLCIKGK